MPLIDAEIIPDRLTRPQIFTGSAILEHRSIYDEWCQFFADFVVSLAGDCLVFYPHVKPQSRVKHAYQWRALAASQALAEGESTSHINLRSSYRLPPRLVAPPILRSWRQPKSVQATLSSIRFKRNDGRTFLAATNFK